MHVLHEKLFNAMSNPRFLSGEAAGAETPFYICPYDVAKSAEMEESIQLLSKRLEDNGIHTLSIDLFALMVDTMKENDDFDWTIEHEDGQTCEELREDLHGILEEGSVIAPAIKRRLEATPPEKRQIIFITNIGACYPVIRAHKLLNNLPSIIGRTPLVMFFPGEYRQVPGSGASLSLFGKLAGDGYYRAFDISEIQI